MTVSLAIVLALGQTAPTATANLPTKIVMEFDSADAVADVLGLIKSVAGVEEATSEGAKITFTVKVAEQVKLSDIKKAIATLKPKPSIKYETLKLEGAVTLKFDHLKDNDYDKVQKGLWRAPNVVSAELGILGYECKFKAPGSPIVEIAKLVGAWSGTADSGATTIEAMSFIYEVIWNGPDKPKEALAEASPAPAAPAPAPAPRPVMAKPEPKPVAAPPPPPPPPAPEKKKKKKDNK